MTNNECTKCIHKCVCKTAESCDGFVSGCKHFNPGWISVKDRLPKPFTPVLVYRKSFGTLPPYIKVDKMTLWNDDTQVWTDEVGNWKNVTTHWMPLPQPPKGE